MKASSNSLSRSAESKFYKNHTSLIGIDEAGRGPLAGPVVTAACHITDGVFIDGINDSKKTKEEEREEMYGVLTQHPDVHWAVSIVSHTEIDNVNILQATMNGMCRCTEEVVKKLRKNKSKDTFLGLVDGNRVPSDLCIDGECVIKGDSIIFSIAAASIIAKVTRDRIMVELDRQYPVYKLARHKGYPTAEHRALLMQHGPSDIHRTSYAPVQRALEAMKARSRTNKKKVNDDDSNSQTESKLITTSSAATKASSSSLQQQKRTRINKNSITAATQPAVQEEHIIPVRRSSRIKSIEKDHTSDETKATSARSTRKRKTMAATIPDNTSSNENNSQAKKNAAKRSASKK
eukprot:CAMPEP_0175013262 /NCGR_PEP_ID=MMETSP0005-20121125/9810_1 /TAXON_ID=420556 /ORGANISM="Ochromonas sp., Strain CCMP1393" /LENGTH=347 /DNA_ID=CAMNT_0016269677 /DNA_START=34 /DNA_END=1077 /DNA_ORIENTATION=+